MDVLVDGGSWANFPSFVFTDLDFRSWFLAACIENDPNAADPESRGLIEGEATQESNRHTLGFVLSEARVSGGAESGGDRRGHVASRAVP